MRIAGVIAEFNPFHNGHAALCAAARSSGATHVIAVMSGNFVQRADFAIAEKRVRAACALASGVDLVLELPVGWAVSPAPTFARGGIGILAACGCVDMLCFGSESGDAALLRQLSGIVDTPEVGHRLREILAEGNITFAKAREAAVRELHGDTLADHLHSPNDLLGIEYLRQAEKLFFSPELLVFKRQGVSHHAKTPSTHYASASWLRARANKLEDYSHYIPRASMHHLREARKTGLFPADRRRVELAVLARLRTLSHKALAALPDVSEGLENRMFYAIHTATSIAELEQALKTKRYTLARVRRLILSAYLGIPKNSADGYPPYLRILGIGPGGPAILSRMKKSCIFPVETSLKRLSDLGGFAGATADLEASTTDLYTLALPKALPCGYDMTTKAVINTRENRPSQIIPND